MSLRTESLRAYRQLYRSASVAAIQCSLYNQEGLQRYVSRRFQQEVEHNRRRIGLSLTELEERAKKLAAAPGKTARTRQAQREVAARRKKLLRQYEQFISQQVDHTRDLAAMLPHASGEEALTSILQVLAAGVGNVSYQRIMEDNFASFFAFAEKQAARDEATEEATSERQNRIMQQAILPYGERLLLVHRTAIGEGNRGSSLAYLTPWQVTEAVVGTRSGVTAHHLKLGRNHLVVEVDETYNKQVVYLACARADGSEVTALDSGSYQWDQEVEGVEVSESEEVRQTMFHSEFLLMATRLCDALVNETPIHPTRKTVLVGHAVGGAVSLIMALLLSQRGFEISNVITFGAPKSLQSTLERYVVAVNPVRVVLAGDPLVELPVTGSEGEPFRHVGEILVLNPRPSTQEAENDGSGESMQRALRQRHQAVTALDDGEDEDVDEDKGDDDGRGISLSAEDLAAAMMDEDERDVVAEETADSGAARLDGQEGLQNTEATLDPSDAPDGEGTEDAEAAEEDNTPSPASDEEHDSDDEADLRELCRIAAARYKQHFLVEDYIRHLADPSVELTYAEGDEVWDDGEYQTSVRREPAEPPVSQEERRQRDLRGPL